MHRVAPLHTFGVGYLLFAVRCNLKTAPNKGGGPSLLRSAHRECPDTPNDQYIPHCWYDVLYEMLCWFYTRCNRTHTFQKVQLLLHQSTEYLLKSLGDNQDIFVKCETRLCVLFGQQWLLSWSSLMDAVPSLFLIVES